MPPDPSTAKPRPRLHTALIIGVSCSFALIALSMVVFVVLYFARSTQLFVDAAPARGHLEGVDTSELLRVARALGSDPERQGFVYWNPAAEAPQPRMERPAGARDLAELPAIIRDMAPLQVIVGGGGLKLTWDRPPYDYGYTMLLMPDGADEARLMRHNGDGHWTEKLQDGIWSFYAFD